jgi:hypothetical protein
MVLRVTLSVCSVFLLLVFTACSSDESSVGDDGVPDMSSDLTEEMDAALDDLSAEEVMPDETEEDLMAGQLDLSVIDTRPDPACESVGEWVVAVTGTVINESGEGFSGVKAQVCVRVAGTGQLLCLMPADTLGDGSFAIEIPTEAKCISSMVMRVLAPLTDNATIYCHVDVEGLGPILAIETPLTMYETVPAVDLPDPGDGENSVTATFEDGLQIDVVPNLFYGGGDGYLDLAVRRFDSLPGELCFLQDQPQPDALFAFSPEGDINGANFPMRIPNELGYSPGSEVAMYVLGGLTTVLPEEVEVEEAEWFEFGAGIVSDNGEVIEAELPYFSWFGYRLLE